MFDPCIRGTLDWEVLIVIVRSCWPRAIPQLVVTLAP